MTSLLQSQWVWEKLWRHLAIHLNPIELCSAALTRQRETLGEFEGVHKSPPARPTHISMSLQPQFLCQCQYFTAVCDSFLRMKSEPRQDDGGFLTTKKNVQSHLILHLLTRALQVLRNLASWQTGDETGSKLQLDMELKTIWGRHAVSVISEPSVFDWKSKYWRNVTTNS